ncbi:hypothetical protein Val02_38030 [Virgisporangium aliadipatigenens]|uniref:HTH merR-type domain-containing protein n=1 Tax=Virgisporangium aliadipatigenens TaxID=741659 RepID=A0A8J4DS50_9ACTN|nr:MerR family transcriptional regulator [Virgisporangium aliadipatigenens]GIJ46917.1 hypothetical protein Val02_38030 [Virgisporangium aliadipatigenens]
MESTSVTATHSIGRFARSTGLTISALRFYDRAGVLVPAVVDPSTGYRWYTDAQVRPARLVAALRRVGLPIADIVLVLRLGGDRPAVQRVLDRHLRRLEDGLTDARRELTRAIGLIGPEQRVAPAVVSVSAARLAMAFDAVRFAVCRDPALPGLGGVRFDLGDGMLRLVATDRYRLAVAGVPAPGTGALTAPTDLLDAARGILDGADDATVTLAADRLTVAANGREIGGVPLPEEFPDYRPLLRAESAHRHVTDATALRSALTGGPVVPVTRHQDGTRTEVSVLTVDAGGTLRVGSAREEPDARLRVGFNREFLLEAIAAGHGDQLVLELDGPIAPLAVRRPDDVETFSILMPTRLD